MQSKPHIVLAYFRGNAMAQTISVGSLADALDWLAQVPGSRKLYRVDVCERRSAINPQTGNMIQWLETLYSVTRPAGRELTDGYKLNQPGPATKHARQKGGHHAA